MVGSELNIEEPGSSILVILEHRKQHSMETLDTDVPQLLDHKLSYHLFAGLSNFPSSICRQEREGGRERSAKVDNVTKFRSYHLLVSEKVHQWSCQDLHTLSLCLDVALPVD